MIDSHAHDHALVALAAAVVVQTGALACSVAMGPRITAAPFNSNAPFFNPEDVLVQ
jgi:hypothetical protein